MKTSTSTRWTVKPRLLCASSASLARPEEVGGDEVDLQEDPEDDEARRHEDRPLEAALGACAHRP